MITVKFLAFIIIMIICCCGGFIYGAAYASDAYEDDIDDLEEELHELYQKNDKLMQMALDNNLKID